MRPSQLRSISFPAYPSVRISTVFQHCRRAFLLCSSTQCCTQCTHFAWIPTVFQYFSACISIASGGKESLISQPLHFYWMYCSPAGLLCSSTFLCAHPYRIPALDCVHFYHVQELPVCICISSSTFLCAHPYCTPALHACTSTIFKQFLCAFLCVVSTFLRAHFYSIPALCACIPTNL